jgi:hypothetical protein
MSLWRKRNVQHNEHNEQKHDNLSVISIKSNMMWIDPPEGWRYGFPAIYDPEKDGQMSDWIVRKGYPLLTIKEYGESWTVRCWPVEQPKGEE